MHLLTLCNYKILQAHIVYFLPPSTGISTFSKEPWSFCWRMIFGLPWWLSSKESSCQAENAGSIPESGRSPGEGNGNPLQYSCLGNPMDRGGW